MTMRPSVMIYVITRLFMLYLIGFGVGKGQKWNKKDHKAGKIVLFY